MKQKRIRIGRLDTAGGIAYEHGKILKKLMRELIDPQLANRVAAPALLPREVKTTLSTSPSLRKPYKATRLRSRLTRTASHACQPCTVAQARRGQHATRHNQRGSGLILPPHQRSLSSLAAP